MFLYKQKGSDIWWVSLSHPDLARVRRSTGTTDRREAQRIHDEWKAQLRREPPIKGRTWGDAVIAWATKAPRSKSDLQSMAKFGKHYPDRPLTKVDVDSLHKALAFCRTPATFMRYRARLTAILNLARERGWLRDVPKLPVKAVAAQPRSRARGSRPSSGMRSTCSCRCTSAAWRCLPSRPGCGSRTC
jgi:hypothetical protein